MSKLDNVTVQSLENELTKLKLGQVNIKTVYTYLVINQITSDTLNGLYQLQMQPGVRHNLNQIQATEKYQDLVQRFIDESHRLIDERRNA